MANIAEITIENTVKESRQIINNNFANLNEGLSTAGSVKTVNNILPDDNGNITVDLGSYATIIAKMQSFFNGTMEETTLFDATGNSGAWTASPTLSQAFTNFDYITIEFAAGYANSQTINGCGEYYDTNLLYTQMQRAKNLGATRLSLFTEPYSHWYWSLNPQTSTTTYFAVAGYDSCCPRRIVGYKMVATGITNASAVDVSDIQAKVSSMLTTDNHLLLPSGLEVW